MCSYSLCVTLTAAQIAALVLLDKQWRCLMAGLQASPNSLKDCTTVTPERDWCGQACRNPVMLHPLAFRAVQAVPAGTSGTSEAEAHSAVGLLHEAGAEAPADRSSAPAEAAEPLQPTASEAAAAAALGSSESGASSEGSEGEEADGTQEEAAAAGPPTSQVLSAADLELMQSMGRQGQ